MSSQPVSSNQGLLSTGTSGTGSLLQITGLASNLDTNSIINALMAIDRQPVTALTKQQQGLNALKSQLTSIQSALQTLSLNAEALGSPTLFANSQTVTSSDSLTIDGKPVTVAAGESIQSFVQSINSDSNQTVYAAAIDNSTVVLSNRATGAPPTGGTFIAVNDAGGTLTEQAALARAGQDASYSIDNVSHTSSSNTITGAIGPGQSDRIPTRAAPGRLHPRGGPGRGARRRHRRQRRPDAYDPGRRHQLRHRAVPSPGRDPASVGHREHALVEPEP